MAKRTMTRRRSRDIERRRDHAVVIGREHPNHGRYVVAWGPPGLRSWGFIDDLPTGAKIGDRGYYEETTSFDGYGTITWTDVRFRAYDTFIPEPPLKEGEKPFPDPEHPLRVEDYIAVFETRYDDLVYHAVHDIEHAWHDRATEI